MRGPTVSLIFFFNGVITLVNKSSIASVIIFFTIINISLHTASCGKIRTQNVLGQTIYILEVDGTLLSGANIQGKYKRN